MTLAEFGEDDLVAELEALGIARPSGVVRGISDDAAVYAVSPGCVSVVSTDLLVEDVHFRLGRCAPEILGHKSLAVNLSDLAAMGATAREAFVGLAAPGDTPVEVVRGFFAGLTAEARRYDVNLLGGDLSASPNGIVVSVTVVGEAPAEQLVYRSGARVGDVFCVTGTLGDSAAGLMLLERRFDVTDLERAELVRRHHQPTPRLAVGRWLGARGCAHAMIDLSDGLATDLRRIVVASGGVGATIEAARLPMSPSLEVVARDLGVDPIDVALGGGEDYELLVAVDRDHVDEVVAGLAHDLATRLTPIGRIEAESGVRIARDGLVVESGGGGYRHWRRSGSSA